MTNIIKDLESVAEAAAITFVGAVSSGDVGAALKAAGVVLIGSIPGLTEEIWNSVTPFVLRVLNTKSVDTATDSDEAREEKAAQLSASGDAKPQN